jgi:NAD(P)-dependent dehydrogenase (short-subunit alcohol dehydrogenase family)
MSSAGPAEGRVALVSGATSGIGSAVAARLARDGFRVTGIGLAADAARTGEGVRVVEADVRRSAEVVALVDAVLAEHGRIDVLCNAAGIKVAGDVLASSAADWDDTFAVNVKGLVTVVRAVLPTMVAQRSGSIVNIGSPSALADPAALAYGASKAAVAAITTSLALAHVADGVRVNLVVPGSTRTGMNAGRPEAVERKLARLNVAGRVNEPEDVAEAVAYLASDASATVTGARIDVGWTPGVVPGPLLGAAREGDHG